MIGDKIENINVIKLDYDKSYVDGDMLFIDDKSYNCNDLIAIFKNEKQYKEANSGIEFAQTHFEEEIYLDSDDIGDIYLQIQSPSFTLKDLNPNWDSDEHYIEDEKMENFINDIV